MRAKVIVAAALLLGLVAWDFAAATTFVGDDYLFLAFARLEPNPLLAFVRDMHGGEYYRPVPMLLWWLLNRAGQGASWPFALAGFLLHAGSAALVVALGRGVGFTLRVSLAAGALFLVAPAEREAALWFAASTDLLATLATLACAGLPAAQIARLASGIGRTGCAGVFFEGNGAGAAAAWDGGEVGGVHLGSRPPLRTQGGEGSSQSCFGRASHPCFRIWLWLSGTWRLGSRCCAVWAEPTIRLRLGGDEACRWLRAWFMR